MREEAVAQACHVLSDSIMLLLSPQLHNRNNRCQGATRAVCPNLYRGKHLLHASTRNTLHTHTHSCLHTSTDWRTFWLPSCGTPNIDSYPLQRCQRLKQLPEYDFINLCLWRSREVYGIALQPFICLQRAREEIETVTALLDSIIRYWVLMNAI